MDILLFSFFSKCSEYILLFITIYEDQDDEEQHVINRKIDRKLGTRKIWDESGEIGERS